MGIFAQRFLHGIVCCTGVCCTEGVAREVVVNGVPRHKDIEILLLQHGFILLVF